MEDNKNVKKDKDKENSPNKIKKKDGRLEGGNRAKNPKETDSENIIEWGHVETCEGYLTKKLCHYYCSNNCDTL